jgi:hypothetical protein
MATQGSDGRGQLRRGGAGKAAVGATGKQDIAQDARPRKEDDMDKLCEDCTYYIHNYCDTFMVPTANECYGHSPREQAQVGLEEGAESPKFCYHDEDWSDLYGPYDSKEKIIEEVKVEMCDCRDEEWTIYIGPVMPLLLETYLTAEGLAYLANENMMEADTFSLGCVVSDEANFSIRTIQGAYADEELKAALAEWTKRWVKADGFCTVDAVETEVTFGPGDEGWEEDED